MRDNLFQSLKDLLSYSPGKIPVYLQLHTPSKSRVQMVVGEEFFVSPSEDLIQDIENLLGEERLSLVI